MQKQRLKGTVVDDKVARLEQQKSIDFHAPFHRYSAAEFDRARGLLFARFHSSRKFASSAGIAAGIARTGNMLSEA